MRRAALGVIRIMDEQKFNLDLAPILGKAQGELLPFLNDRFYVYCRDKGFAHDVLRADKSAGFDVAARLQRLDALAQFLNTDDGKNFIQAWRRVHSILAQSKLDAPQKINPAHFDDASEEKLFTAFSKIKTADALTAMPNLTAPINAFFEAVKVNDDAAERRNNRLAMLKNIDDWVLNFADFSQLEGGARGDDDDEMGL